MQYTNYAMKNNVFGTLSAPISSLATSIQLATGQGQRFTVDMLATLESMEGNKVTKREIVKITNVTGDTLTVIRKFAPCPSSDDANTQGQVSYSFSADDTISVYITKEHFDKIDGSINDLYDNGTNKLRTEVISGLQIKVNPGTVLIGSAYYDFAGDTITLTDNATNYVEIDEDGNLVVNTSAWGDKNAKIALVTTSGGAITSIEDKRLGTVGGELSKTNIHDLTEKTNISADDELIISDSNNIRQNKKIKYRNIQPATMIRYVTLGENVTAGNGLGACYIDDNDGLAYLSYVAGQNHVDGIIIDSGNAGDRVRMVVGGFVPYNWENDGGEVYLNYTPTNTNTGYGGHIVITTDTTLTAGGIYLITVDGTGAGVIAQNTNSIDFLEGILLPLYGAQGTTFGLTASSGTQYSVYYADTSVAHGAFSCSDYSNLCGCKIGERCPGGFMFTPEPKELFVGLSDKPSTGITTTNAVQAKYGGFYNFITYNYSGSSTTYVSAYLFESVTGQDGTRKRIADKEFMANTGSIGTAQRVKIKKGFYYKISYRGTNSQRQGFGVY